MNGTKIKDELPRISLAGEVVNDRNNVLLLEQRIDELERQIGAVNRQLDAATAISTILNLIKRVDEKAHSSSMPDYGGGNSDHDKRYVRISAFAASITTAAVLLGTDWKIIVSGTDLSFQRYEGGIWVEKFSVTA